MTMTWRELLEETLRAGLHTMDELREADAVEDALWSIGAIWDRASEALDFPDSAAPELDDDTGLAVDAVVDEVLERIWEQERNNEAEANALEEA